MKRSLGTMFVTVIAVVLAIYSGWRSLDFIQMTIPPDQKILGYLALVATEGGIFCWLIYYLYGAEGGWQRSIGLVMTLVDLLGAIGLFTADTLLRSGERGLTVAMQPEEIRGVILGLSGLIALNISATVACHLLDPENRKRAAEQEAFSKVEDEAIKHINDSAATLAAQLAPLLAADWMRDTHARYTARLGSGVIPSTANIIDAKARDTRGDGEGRGAATSAPSKTSPNREPKAPPTTSLPNLEDNASITALAAAVLNVLQATQPAPGGNGHHKGGTHDQQPDPRTYESASESLPPICSLDEGTEGGESPKNAPGLATESPASQPAQPPTQE